MAAGEIRRAAGFERHAGIGPDLMSGCTIPIGVVDR
jgi:hypothetical protein